MCICILCVCVCLLGVRAQTHCCLGPWSCGSFAWNELLDLAASLRWNPNHEFEDSGEVWIPSQRRITKIPASPFQSWLQKKAMELGQVEAFSGALNKASKFQKERFWVFWRISLDGWAHFSRLLPYIEAIDSAWRKLPLLGSHNNTQCYDIISKCFSLLWIVQTCVVM